MRPSSVLSLVILFEVLAHATPLTVVNPGFESPQVAPGTFATSAPPPAWSPYGTLDFGFRTIGVLHPATTTLYDQPPPDGSNVGVVFLLDDPANQAHFANQEAGLLQTLSDALQTSTRYTLRVNVGNIANDPNPPHDAFQFTGFPGYRVDLLAGGTVIASDPGSLLPGEGRFLETPIEVEIGAAHALAGQPLGIRLVNRNAAPGLEVNFDDVRLDAVDIAAWTDLGHATAGVAGSPRLVGGGPLSPGSSNHVALTDAAPSSAATLIVGLSQVDLPLFGGTLVPSPLLLVPLATGAAGSTTLPFTWPPAVPAGTAIFLQFWIPDPTGPVGYAASNGLRGISS